MVEPVFPDVIIYVCANCKPAGGRLPRQWSQCGLHVSVREVPCSGKMDSQYLLNAIEGGVSGLCVVTCPKGGCRLGQGNYRAEVRLGTIRRLLGEVGIEPERIELLNYAAADPFKPFEEAVRASVERICALGKSPIALAASEAVACDN